MDAGINNVFYMELHSGPKMANSTCGKTIVAGTIDRGSTVLHKTLNDGKLKLCGGTLCVVSKGNGKVVLVFAVNAYRGSRGIVLHILNLGARCWRVVSIIPWLLDPPRKELWYPLNRRLGWPVSKSR